MHTRGLVIAALVVAACARPVAAQQRPLLTEDPEVIGAGRVLVEGGLDYSHDQAYPVSGLRGNLWRVPTVGVSVGISFCNCESDNMRFFNCHCQLFQSDSGTSLQKPRPAE